jgi:probable phosphoglycerate mutase
MMDALEVNRRPMWACEPTASSQRVRAVDDDVLFFSSGHFLRVFAARWLGLEVAIGRCFMLSTASLSAVSYEHKLSQPAIRLWDDTRHVAG